MQLEKAFPSSSKIKPIYSFVRDCLNEEAKSIKFVLCTRYSDCCLVVPGLLTLIIDQPPGRDLKVSDAAVRDKTLMELQLAPSSVLFLKFLSDELNSGFPGIRNQTTEQLTVLIPDRDMLPPLKSDILSSAADFPAAQEISASEEPRASSSKAVNEKQVNNKLARFLKLHPKP
jgi:tether containing UBX domain for GLUT4